MNMEEMFRKDAELIANSSVNWDKMSGKTILISGATGYVSQYIVHGLLKRNDLFHTNVKIIALCRSKERADLRFSRYYAREDFELLIQDVQIPVAIEQEVHYIIHTASPAGLVNSNINPVETFKVNVFGCDNLLMLAEKKKAEFLLFSSVDVYGKIEEKRFVEPQRFPGHDGCQKCVRVCKTGIRKFVCLLWAKRCSNKDCPPNTDYGRRYISE